MRRWRSLLLSVGVAGLTVLLAWLLLAWVDAGAPSLADVARAHPVLGGLFGMASTLGMAWLAWWQRRRKSR